MSRALLILLLLLGSLGRAQTVCIDPGHPSEVGEGTRGKRITEMKAAWKVALLLKVGIRVGNRARGGDALLLRFGQRIGRPRSIPLFMAQRVERTPRQTER